MTGPLEMWELEEMFDDFLDSTEDTIKLLGLTFNPSDVLKSCDRIAYRDKLLEYINIEINSSVIEYVDGEYYKV